MYQPPAALGEEVGTYDFPVFEAFEPDDRPLPPDEEDFPIDCQVELVDVASAKIAQTPALWEPFMEALFQNKVNAVIKRHRGDYTFVLCQDVDQPDVTIGCTLYRACLKEPKVKMKKYIPTDGEGGAADPQATAMASPRAIAAPSSAIPLSGDDALFTVLGDDDQPENDFLAAPIAPEAAPVAAAAPHITREPSPRTESPGRDFRQRVSVGVPAPSMNQNMQVPPLNAQLQHKAKKIMNAGNTAFANKEHERAVMLYTEAYELDRSDAPRILSNRSAALLALKRPEAALADARAVMRLTPKSSVGYIRAGNVFQQLRRFDEAKLCYEKALALDANKGADMQFSLRNNAVQAVYHSKTERLPVTVQVDRQLHVALVSKRSVRPGEVAWTESTSTVVPINLHSDPSSYCGHCYRSLIRSHDLALQIPGVDVGVVASLMREANLVPCHEGCSQRYCGEACRLKAWTEHHWIECDVRGRWTPVVPQLHTIFRDVSASFDPQLIASVRLALRMMVRVMSSGRQLAEAINNFAWLHEQSTLSHEEQVVISNVLTPAYLTLHECLTREERALIDLSFVVGLFKRCRQCMVKITATPWPGIIANVETNLAMIRLRGASHPGLESILQLQPSRMKGVQLECLVVFEVFSLALPTPDHPDCREPNIAMRREVETANMGSFYALRPITRNSSLKSAR